MQSAAVQYSFDETVPLSPTEKNKLLNRNQWDAYVGSVPLPALWVSAHVDISQSRPQYAALDQLVAVDLKVCRSRDSIATAYRVFLQKLLTQLNRKILQSRNSSNTFRFLGSLECGADGSIGLQPHFHFFLWEPSGLFNQNHLALPATAWTLQSLWLQKVNSKETARYKPIDIQIVRTSEDANRVALYTNKSNHHIEGYELFDDWSSSITGGAVDAK